MPDFYLDQISLLKYDLIASPREVDLVLRYVLGNVIHRFQSNKHLTGLSSEYKKIKYVVKYYMDPIVLLTTNASSQLA